MFDELLTMIEKHFRSVRKSSSVPFGAKSGAPRLRQKISVCPSNGMRKKRELFFQRILKEKGKFVNIL